MSGKSDSSTMTTNFSGRSAFAGAAALSDNINMRQSQIRAQPGEYWLVSREGEQDWPVVICDEEIVQKYFKGPRPENACRPDGAWHDLLQPGDELLGQASFPVLYLGTCKIRWSAWKCLKPLDFQLAVAIRDTTLDKTLEQAYHDGLGMYGWNNLDYWKDKLCAVKLAEDTAPAVNKTGKRKRRSMADKSVPKFKWPPGFGPGYGDEQLHDDEEELLLAAGEGKGRKIKKEVLDTATLEEINALYEVSDREDAVATRKESKTAVPDHSSSIVMPPSSSLVMPPATSASKYINSNPMKTGKLQASETPNDMSMVRVYVGNPHSEFTIKRNGLDANSPFLSRLVSSHPSIGFYVMSPLLSSLSAYDFTPVAEYLDHGEYYPKLLNEDTKNVRLEDVELEREEDVHGNHQHVGEVTRCGKIYAMAQQLELQGLRSLAFQKLKTLGSYPAKEFLSIVLAVDFSPRIGMVEEVDELRAFVVSYLAEHFYELVREETEVMLAVMEGNAVLAMEVFRKLGGEEHPRAGLTRTEQHSVNEQKLLRKSKASQRQEQWRRARTLLGERAPDGATGNKIKEEAIASFRIYEEA